MSLDPTPFTPPKQGFWPRFFKRRPVFVVETWWGLALWIFFLGVSSDITKYWLHVWGWL